MKSAERYELIKQGLEEGKNKSAIAREMGVSPALISQVMKKHSITPVPPGVNQEAAASTAEV